MDSLKIAGQALVSASLLIFFLDIFFAPRIKARLLRYLLTFSMFCAINLALSSGIAIELLDSQLVQLRLFASILIYSCTVMLLFKGHTMMKLFVVWLFYLLTLGMEYTFIILGNALIQWQLILRISNFGLFAMWLMSRLVIFATVFLISQFCRRKNNGLTLKFKEWCLFLYFPLLTIVVILFFLGQSSFTDAGMAALIFGMLIMNLLIVYLLHASSERRRIEYETQLIQERYNNEISALQIFKRTSDGQRRLIHDFHNQATCAAQLVDAGNYEKAKDYLNTITGNTVANLIHFCTNNEVVDAILNQKYMLAESRDICFQVDASNLSELSIADEDIVAILANVLDNAIEATQKVTVNRIIRVKLIYDNNEFLIAVANPVAEDVITENDILPTSKTMQDGIHGYGLLSVKIALEKYGAEYAIQCDDKCFLFSAIIIWNG